MTDEQIIKALEFCADTEFSACYKCPVCPSEGSGCIERLCPDALALIKRQKKQLLEQMLTVDEHCDKCIAEIRAEAIREFAERIRLETCDVHPLVLGFMREVVNNIEQEMTEEQK